MACRLRSLVEAGALLTSFWTSQMHMSATMASAAVLMDWTHELTPESDGIQYVPSPPLLPQAYSPLSTQDHRNPLPQGRLPPQVHSPPPPCRLERLSLPSLRYSIDTNSLFPCYFPSLFGNTTTLSINPPLSLSLPSSIPTSLSRTFVAVIMALDLDD